MKRYSAASLFTEGLRGHTGWQRAWRHPDPKPAYDVVIVGAGGHGLATAYYLAKEHGITNVAVVEKGWLGGGNTGRNTTVVRSNYLYPESAALYEKALQLYEGLSKDLNYNIMLSQRGMLEVAHSRHELEACAYWANAMRLNGIDSEVLTRDEVIALVPGINVGPGARYPVCGGYIQRRGGIARHDAVAWGYARAADARGVDIIQNCEVTGFRRDGAGTLVGVETTRGFIGAKKVALAVAGHSSVMAERAGFRLPVKSYALQAMVTEPVKPMLDTVVMSLATGVYMSQSDKGELVIGGGLDLYGSYAQRGNFPTIEKVVASAIELIPAIGRLKLMRTWAGIVDVTHDSSPIIDRAPVQGVYVNCGWGTGGFKAIPVGGYTLAHLLARDEPHPLAIPFSLRRFETGRLIDEAAASGIPH